MGRLSGRSARGQPTLAGASTALRGVQALEQIATAAVSTSDSHPAFGLVQHPHQQVGEKYGVRCQRRVIEVNDAVARRVGLSLRTIRRRLSSVSGFYAYLLARGDTSVVRNPVPQGLTTRREGERRRRRPLVRAVTTLPRVLAPAEVDALTGALHTARDRAMVDAMVLGGLCRCEVLGLRLEDVRLGERRVFIADGKGGRQRLIRCRRGSSPRSPATSTKNARPGPAPTRCSWC